MIEKSGPNEFYTSLLGLFLRHCKFDQERNLNDHDNSKEYKHFPLRPRTNPDTPKKETDKSLTECEAKQFQQIY